MTSLMKYRAWHIARSQQHLLLLLSRRLRRSKMTKSAHPVDWVTGEGLAGHQVCRPAQHHFPDTLAKLNLFNTPSLRQIVSSLGTGTKGPSSERGPRSLGKAKASVCSQFRESCGRAGLFPSSRVSLGPESSG